MKRMRGREQHRQKVYENLATIRRGDFVILTDGSYGDEEFEVMSDAYQIEGIWYINLFEYGRVDIAKLEKVTA